MWTLFLAAVLLQDPATGPRPPIPDPNLNFRAVFESRAPAPAPALRIQAEFASPDRLRVESAAAERSSTAWCVEGVWVVTGVDAKSPFHGRASASAVEAELAADEGRLRAEFPTAAARRPGGACLSVRWGVEPATSRAAIALECVFADERTTPLGWWDTLESKGVALREDGEWWRGSSDGVFEFSLSRADGMLREIVGRDSNGEQSLRLIEYERLAQADAARFALGVAPSNARDVSADMTRTMRRNAELGFRRRAWNAMAAARPEQGDAELAAWSSRVDRVLSGFYLRVVPASLTSWLERSKQIESGVRDRLKQLREKGKSESELAEVRARELGYLRGTLDELENDLVRRLAAPSGVADSPASAPLLEREHAAARAAFVATVRNPVLESFQAAIR